jgi:hypothetical protein
MTETISATQIAQQKLQEPSAAKSGASKFDGVMTDKAGAAGKAQGASQVNHVEAVKQVEYSAKVERIASQKVTAQLKALEVSQTQVVHAKEKASKAVGLMAKVMEDMEKGQSVMDKLIKAGMSGKEFNSSELLVLQAGMYKYTQELELTGKVVEKATSGLRDTLKTQV